MARRGLLATIVHQSQVAARDRERAQRAAVREHNAAMRRVQQAQRAAESLRQRLARASEAERKRLEREARDAYIAAREAEAEEQNLKLEEIYSEIDSLLIATLGKDDYVDLETLRAAAVHPPFDRADLEVPSPAPEPIPEPPKPERVVPEEPRGLLAGLFGRSKYAAAVAKAGEVYEQELATWREQLRLIPAKREEALSAHARAEAERVSLLEAARARYAQECAAREAEAEERNKRLDKLITNLGYGTSEAIEEYISIVLANSDYPGHFRAVQEFAFDSSSSELRLRVLVPGPDQLPEVKAFKYAKSTDEITQTALSPKVCRERYSGAVHQVALRSLHEVFEADRRGLVRTIALELGTETIDPATGQHTYIPFIVVGADREAFLKFDLSAVVPARTLERMGAAVSKNPHGLVAVENSGVRRS